jgi:Anti-sigma-28 factor, FlgM.
MKIQSNQYYNFQSNMTKRSNSSKNENTKSVCQKRNFDELVIHSRPVSVTDESFAADLSTEVSAQVRAVSSDEKLDSLKAQIENGTYQIDLDAIVKKMLLG